MDQVAVRRTRKFVKDNYKGETIMGPGGKRSPSNSPTRMCAASITNSTGRATISLTP